MTKDFLEKYLEIQWDIIVDLNISITNLLRLKEGKYLYEDKIKKHGFFQHHWYQLKFISIIQLAKLYSDDKSNDKRNFHKFCSIIEDSAFSHELEYQLFKDPYRKNSNLTSRDELRSLAAQIRRALNENKDVIEKVIAARDRVYAHADPQSKVSAVKPEELVSLIDLANQIHNKWTQLLFNITNLHHTGGWEIDYVLREMSEIRKLELENPERLFPPAHNIDYPPAGS